MSCCQNRARCHRTRCLQKDTRSNHNAVCCLFQRKPHPVSACKHNGRSNFAWHPVASYQRRRKVTWRPANPPLYIQPFPHFPAFPLHTPPATSHSRERCEMAGKFAHFLATLRIPSWFLVTLRCFIGGLGFAEAPKKLFLQFCLWSLLGLTLRRNIKSY